MNKQNQNPQKKESAGGKIYAIDGLTEYLLRVPVGATSVEFHFDGGMLSGYGVRPATLCVNDPLGCRIIESTPQFRSGKIRILRHISLSA